MIQLGSNHADVATTMANTAGLLKALGKQSEAETVYRTVRLLDLYARCLISPLFWHVSVQPPCTRSAFA